MRRAIAITIGLLFVFSASTAWALDGYEDRRGLYIGAGLGGGTGSVYVADEAGQPGLAASGDFGLTPHFVVGGGMTENLIFGAEVNNWMRLVSVNENRLNHQHWSFNAVGDLFLVHGLYLEAGLGLAYGFMETDPADSAPETYGEMGVSTKAGVGFEYFVNGTVAAGMSFGYTRHFYNANVDFDTFIGKVTMRWY